MNLIPMKRPDYSVPENATPDDLRQVAVRAMLDLLSIPWTPDKVYSYKNRYDWPHKTFEYPTGLLYRGLPYANAHTGIFQWLKFYDQETGVMSFPGDGQTWGETLGTVCADCILWAWSTVCNSIGAATYTFHMVPKYNFLPVGRYERPCNMDSFREEGNTTDDICKTNSLPVMCKAYAEMLPADAVVSTSAGHILMAMRAPEITYDDQGQIDPDNSFLYIYDQSGGTQTFFHEIEEDGQIAHYVGHTNLRYKFSTLFTKGYIPITTAEFKGIKPYTQPSLTVEGECNCVRDISGLRIRTNYPMCTVEAVVLDETGAETRVAVALYRKSDVKFATGMEGYSYCLDALLKNDLEAALENRSGATLLLRADLSTGHEYEIARFTI